MMIRKKNKFLTFLFSLIPGAGEMYMGFMKQGISLMGAFLAAIVLQSDVFYNFSLYVLALPLIWAYSFFHTHNIKNMPDEEFYALEDGFLFKIDEVLPKDGNLKRQYTKVFSYFLIILGIVLLWTNCDFYVRMFIPDDFKKYYYGVANRMPSIIVSIFMIWWGLKLVKGKKKELYQEDDENNNDEVQSR